VKVAMADVMALFVIAMFTMAVAGFGLAGKGDASILALIVAIGPFVGAATLIAAVMAYLNENLLATAIFGPLAVFFFTIVVVGGVAASWLCLVIGVIILIDALVAFAQPVKMLPILLLIAAVAFFVTSVWYDATTKTNSEDYRAIVGALWLVYSLLSFYMAAAIMMLVMKGKQVLPLFIKA
jgi:hypothetical protein